MVGDAPVRSAGRLLSRVARASASRLARRRTAPRSPRSPRSTPPSGPTAAGHGAYRGDFTGTATITYAPRADGRADPGEVVWAWVPYEEDASQGKDRPVLVLAMEGGDLLGLMLTSKDHSSRRPRTTSGDGPRYLDLGTGDWDARRRPSEVRLDRVLRLAPAAVRREGAALDQARFDDVAAAARDVLGWS